MQYSFLPSVRIAIVSIALLALTALAGGLLHAQTAAQDRPRPGEPVTLSFNNAEIEAVARTMAIITGRNVVVDPRVKGTINLNTDRPVAPMVAFNQFRVALRLSGFTVVESAGLYLVVPESEAKLQGGSVSAGPVPGGNQIVTQIFRLNFESAVGMVPVLRPLISPNNTINANPGNNSLVITDYSDNLQRIGRIIAALDVANAADVEVIPLKNAIAMDLAPLVTRLLESSSAAGTQGQADTSFRTILIAEPRSNTLILRAANRARSALARALVDKLDQPASGSTGLAGGNIYVVYLKNADATKLATTLRAAMASEAVRGGPVAIPVAAAPPLVGAATGGTATGLGASQSISQSANQPTTGGQIQADPSTNSLIITAPEPQYRQLRAVIDRLDGRRAQVLVESLIAEVNADKAAEFGIQWQGALGKRGNTNIGLLGTNFSIGGTNIISLTTGLANGTAVPSTGGNFGIAHQTNGVYVLGFLARFLESNGDGNVLSTPNLLTLDNEEAKIVIGQNVPFVTGQFTNTGSATNTVNPFQTIERKDVGLTLRVRPQISENGTVKLQIFQEVSSVQASTVNNVNGPTTNKRSIESNVIVDDGAIVVLGGLLQDEYSGNQEKVPGLGDVPLFGNLFKSETRSRKKTNLMVFLRPVVVRDTPTSDALSMDRYDLMRATQRDAQPIPSVMVPVNEAPVLPPLPPARAVPEPLGLTAPAATVSPPTAPPPAPNPAPATAPRTR
ncbi:type II secretion system secretin GspD [Polaromonas sp.]|jgi:general secretion pathway protein D|uniref:type II secretion system secretin GspD n=1 Tax=Polaromonas sp. TaxID=1869339 RepID=UPI0037CC9272